jgi:hypothetical protein
MKMRNTTTLTVGLLTVLVVLVAVDALSIENKRLLTQADIPKQTENTPPEPQIPEGNETPEPQVGTPKMQGPNVPKVLSAEEFTVAEPKKERSLIQQVIPKDIADIQTKILLKDGDRVGLIAWTESPQVKIYFLALKEALHSTFSPKMRDLVDEVQTREGKPPRNLLTFLDPAINSERIVFIRIRERLYEFHIAPERDDVIFDLIESLSR